MSARHIAALGGSLLGVSTQAALVDRLPVVAAAGAVLGLLTLAWAWTRPEPIQEISDAVLYEAHHAAQRLRDDAGAAVIAAELKRREEVSRG